MREEGKPPWEFRREWPNRIEALLSEFADLEGQRIKWSDRPDREPWDSFAELMCQLFDDQHIEQFLTWYENRLHPELARLLSAFVDDVDRFANEHTDSGCSPESVWIDSAEWLRCTQQAAEVVSAVRNFGWPAEADR